MTDPTDGELWAPLHVYLPETWTCRGAVHVADPASALSGAADFPAVAGQWRAAVELEPDPDQEPDMALPGSLITWAETSPAPSDTDWRPTAFRLGAASGCCGVFDSLADAGPDAEDADQVELVSEASAAVTEAGFGTVRVRGLPLGAASVVAPGSVCRVCVRRPPRREGEPDVIDAVRVTFDEPPAAPDDGPPSESPEFSGDEQMPPLELADAGDADRASREAIAAILDPDAGVADRATREAAADDVDPDWRAALDATDDLDVAGDADRAAFDEIGRRLTQAMLGSWAGAGRRLRAPAGADGRPVAGPYAPDEPAGEPAPDEPAGFLAARADPRRLTGRGLADHHGARPPPPGDP